MYPKNVDYSLMAIGTIVNMIRTKFKFNDKLASTLILSYPTWSIVEYFPAIIVNQSPNIVIMNPNYSVLSILDPS